MSDYEDNQSGSDSEVDDDFPTTARKIKSTVSAAVKPVKRKNNEIDSDSEEEDEGSVRSEDEDLDDEMEMTDDEDASDIEELGVSDKPNSTFASSFVNMDYEEEEEDADYLQRFDESTKQDIIAEYHTELQTHNYSEVLALARIVKNEQGEIVDPLHKTMPFLTKYERARVLGERAKQLNAGAEPFVKVDVDVIDGYLIAQRELEEKKLPFILKRPLPDGACEYWRLKDLELLHH
jgi:DNA-directed RNA polymerase I, II, and III subunit RPABC2